MALTKYKLRQLISLCTGGNEDCLYGADSLKGISVNKVFMPSKADLEGESLKNYTVVKPKCFSFVTVTSRNGNKISIAYNNSDESFIVSSFYVTFRLNDYGKSVLLEEYLFLYFNRSEFDRYARQDSWGSAREYFYFENMCNVEIELPPLPVQRKYVAIYKAMIANQQSYERGLEDLKLVCDAYIEDLRRELGVEPLAPYIKPIDERNSNLEITLAQGITIEKQFANPKQVAAAEKNAKIVRRGQFAYNRATTRNGEKISIAYRTGDDCVVSSAYQVFEISAKNKLLPEYLMMWFKRSEFDRYARYMSKGSAHEFFEYSDMEEVEIPIPDITIQQAIADIFTVYSKRKQINERLKAQIKDLCPILVKGAVEEGERFGDK